MLEKLCIVDIFIDTVILVSCYKNGSNWINLASHMQFENFHFHSWNRLEYGRTKTTGFVGKNNLFSVSKSVQIHFMMTYSLLWNSLARKKTLCQLTDPIKNTLDVVWSHVYFPVYIFMPRCYKISLCHNKHTVKHYYFFCEHAGSMFDEHTIQYFGYNSLSHTHIAMKNSQAN